MSISSLAKIEVSKSNLMAYYKPLVSDFQQKMKGVAIPGIERMPEPFLPLFGKSYPSAPVRIAVIGQDTKEWGDLRHFLKSPELWEKEIFNSRFNEFENHSFTGWGKQRQTFFGFVMKLLAEYHGRTNWKAMKKGAMREILDSFAWANCNAIELYSSSVKAKGVPKEFWDQVILAGRHFNKYSHLHRTLNPDVVLILHRKVNFDSYFFGFSKPKLVESIGRINQYEIEGISSKIFHLPHPQSMNRIEGTEFFFENLKSLFLVKGISIAFPLFLSGIRDGERALKFLEENAPRPPGTISKYDCISWIADELCKRDSFMSVTTLVQLLNRLGWRNSVGKKFSTRTRGPYSLVRSTYVHFAQREAVHQSHNIAIAFRKPNFEYAYSV
jgi:hypothetical protein